MRPAPLLHPHLHPPTMLVRLTACVIAAAVVLASTAALLPAERMTVLFGENGPVEWVSLILWLMLAAFALAVVRPVSLPAVAGAIVCLAAAAREADLHGKLTGYSILKPGFYHKPGFPLHHRLLAAAALLLLAFCVFVLLREVVGGIVRHRERGGRLIPSWAVAVLVAVAALASTKVVDRIPVVLIEQFDTRMPKPLFHALLALEEGFEMLLPVLLGMAVWCAVRARAIRAAGEARGARA